MWYKGDYRVIFRHEMSPSQKKIEDALKTMAKKGVVVEISECNDVGTMSVVVLQKRIRENELTAWATLGVAYSFCRASDFFKKKKGSEIAYARAVKQLEIIDHIAVFAELWNNNGK